MEITLIDYARDPLAKLYGAYRTCYTQKSPKEVWGEIANNTIPPEKIRDFVVERLKTGHTSPLEQVVFWFGISGVSRALSHQFVRHRVGISFEQQSQRYCKYQGDSIEFIVPDSIQDNKQVLLQYEIVMKQLSAFYNYATSKGVPAEDARFVLPNATPTNFQIMVNLAELLHICDLRLCTRAQWEIRRMVSKMRAEVKKGMPELAEIMQPKCGEHRNGFCDEDYEGYLGCPLSKTRPHKEDFNKWWEKERKQNGNI